ncbi:TPA: sugar phosphate isomerase/epimerase [bacterium]|nr:sugar phosphate isomerase/epimerase [bacterium]HPC76844.1 sugar phosphate isomerase/epimerase [bacterium]
MSRIPIALQLYSVREECAKDFVGTVKAVSEMGYDGVEFAGYYNLSASELKSILDDFGLKVAGTHIGINTLIGDELQRTIEFNATLGNKFLIVPALPPDYTGTREGWLKVAEMMSEISEKIKPYGMKVGYHNHDIEFKKIDGETPWDIFFQNTSEDVVMQLDIGNAIHGSADPIEILKKYPGRAITVHLKEYPFSAPAVGEGEVNWKEIFNICETIGGTEWYIVEYETPGRPPLESVRRCIENLRRMGK